MKRFSFDQDRTAAFCQLHDPGSPVAVLGLYTSLHLFGEISKWNQPRSDCTCSSILLNYIDGQLAALEPPPPEMQQLFGAIHGNQKAMDGFAQVNAGTISPVEFFSPENIGAIMTHS